MPAVESSPKRKRNTRRPSDRSPRKLDDQKVLAMAKAGIPPSDIAQHQGVARTTVWRFLQQHKDHIADVDAYKAHRADILAGLQGDCLELQTKIIKSFDDGILSALKPHEKTGLLIALNSTHGTIYDKERLERGQSTANVSLIGRMMGSALDLAHKTEPTPSHDEQNQ